MPDVAAEFTVTSLDHCRSLRSGTSSSRSSILYRWMPDTFWIAFWEFPSSLFSQKSLSADTGRGLWKGSIHECTARMFSNRDRRSLFRGPEGRSRLALSCWIVFRLLSRTNWSGFESSNKQKGGKNMRTDEYAPGYSAPMVHFMERHTAETRAGFFLPELLS